MTRQVTFVDLSLRDGELEESLAAVCRVMERGHFILGPELAAFEEEMAATYGLSNVVGVASGTDALILGMRALGIGAGDEVIVPAMTAFPTAAAVVEVGATPVLVDIEADSPLLDLERALAAITPATKAVILVHLYGLAADAAAWRRVLDEYNIALIEDCAQAQGAILPGGGVAGSVGRFAAFSFYPTKNLGALGDAGAVASGGERVALEVRAWRSHGERTTRYEHDLPARNSRLDEVQAAVLRLRLRNLAPKLERRRQLSVAYERELSPMARYVSHGAHGAPHLAVIRTFKRDALVECLRARGIASMIHYPKSLAEQPGLRKEARVTAAPNALRWSRECVSLPLHDDMDHDEVAYVADAVNEWLLQRP